MEEDMRVVFVVGRGTRPFVGVEVYDDELLADAAADTLNTIAAVTNNGGGGRYYVECMPHIVGENVPPAAYWWDSAE